MCELFRLVFCVVALAAVGLAAAQLEPAWARDLSPEGWRPSDLLFPEQARCAGLERQNRAVARATIEKVRHIRRLVEGRETLFETAAMFQQLNREADFPLGNTDCSPEEQACRSVILWVKSDDPELALRLEEELRRHKEQYRAVVLPGVETAAGMIP
jgi:hypothetical protein